MAVVNGLRVTKEVSASACADSGKVLYLMIKKKEANYAPNGNTTMAASPQLQSGEKIHRTENIFCCPFNIIYNAG
ncbi:hypothetical protein [Candidatus Kryptonium thompsonii]|uniref:hypothetical protein n=1 Tax=Candidatus Kryptonium thompsonii TaxID=1633631 RepID=UPI00094D7C07|nr:hypothetical protein [Candidatus Kryptonium thompsoni]